MFGTPAQGGRTLITDARIARKISFVNLLHSPYIHPSLRIWLAVCVCVTTLAGSANGGAVLDDFSNSALQIAASEDSSVILICEGSDGAASSQIADLDNNTSEPDLDSLLNILQQQAAGDHSPGRPTSGRQGAEQSASAPIALPGRFTEPPILDLVTWLQASQWLKISPAPALELLRPPQGGLLVRRDQADTIANA